MEFAKTIFLDIDGTILEHLNIGYGQAFADTLEVLPGVYEKLEEWGAKNYNIILVTGRRESVRKETEAQLAKANIVYDQLIMGIGRGERVLINDTKPNSSQSTAIAITVLRNQGLKEISI